MKHATLAAVCALGCAALAPAAIALPINDDFAVDIDLAAASDYRSRGISQTQGDPALQADVMLSHASGLYLGAWTSNVDFGFASKTRQEVDYYAGWAWQMAEQVNLDLGYLRYTYPKESQYNLSEVYAILDVQGFKLAAYYSSDANTQYGKDQDSLYTWVGYHRVLPMEIGLELRYGRVDFKDPSYWSQSGQSRDSYREWEARLSRDFFGLTWRLSYLDTNLSKTECASSYGFDDVCSATVVAAVSKHL